MTRRFIDAPTELRCKATTTLRDKSEAQCGRYAKVDGLCRQHHKMQEAGGRTMKLSAKQQEAVEVLSGRKELKYGQRLSDGWITTCIFDPLTVRSLVRRGIVELSSHNPFDLKHRLDDLSIRLKQKETK